MPSAMTSNRRRDMSLTSGSRSSSGSASPSPGHRVASIPEFYFQRADTSFFEEPTYDSPSESFDSGLRLRRLPRKRSADHGFHYDSNGSLLVRMQPSDPAFISPSQSLSSLDSSYTTYDYSDLVYDRIIDALLALKPNPFLSTGPRNLFMFDPAQHDHLKNESVPPLMIKRVKKSSDESLLLRAINQPHLRFDPWNAAPHILGAVERGDYVYFCMKQLSEYNEPPLLTVEHYIDFFRQVLDRLSFSQENGISGLSLAHPSSYMMDISSGPTLRVDNASSTGQLNRFKYPVHYYFVNFTKATRISKQPLYPSSAPSSPGRESLLCSFQRDVRDCGIMFESLLTNVPQIAENFRPLIEHMKMGHFTHEFFENLSTTLDKNTFESFAINMPSTPHAKRTDTIYPSPPATAKLWKRQSISVDRSLSH